MILLSHPTSNINASATARGLYKHGLLTAYYTCFSWNPDSALARILPRRLTRWLDRRKQVAIPSNLIKTRPMREIMRNVFEFAGVHGNRADEDALFSTEHVYYDLDRLIARQLSKYSGLRGVYCYDDGALAQFQRAQQLGLARIYDLPIGHWRELMTLSRDEADAYPEWSGTMKALSDSAAKKDRKDAELSLAELVIVASSFTKKTLELFPSKKKVVVVPYGVPHVTTPPRTVTKAEAPLRVLFVGQLTQRKGISYLFDAIKVMGKSVSLTLIGTKGGHCKALDEACAKHRWLETLPHSEVLGEMQSHDILLFPSLFEGFGLVIGEALSQGMPVITTVNTGGPDIISDGVEGFIVPIRSTEAIVEKLQILHGDRELLKQMSDAARQRAMELTWDDYEDRVAAAVSSALQPYVATPASTENANGARGGRSLGQEFAHGSVEIGR